MKGHAEDVSNVVSVTNAKMAFARRRNISTTHLQML
jgi:hypothetical protein